MECIPKDRIQ
ncbi:unnamed protein product [Callosobruchus maculatus]|uniref:Uncharacterized protein n=1 Tax=Callosobruchus maculatus TaxID=64391 RepID=A0A653BSB5_CALMS|nr:unnamed protein product [Callosobruchus maculatus]